MSGRLDQLAANMPAADYGRSNGPEAAEPDEAALHSLEDMPKRARRPAKRTPRAKA